MRSFRFVFLFSTLLSAMAPAQSASLSGISQSLANSVAARPNLATPAKIAQSYGKMPLSFEANRGQTDSRVKFLSRTSGYSLFLTADEAVLALSEKKNIDKAKIKSAAHMLRTGVAATKAGGVLRMKLRNANPAAKVTGVDELAGTSNYFIGNDPAKWRSNVPTYAKVKYEGIYSGIDLVYYGTQRQLEYDFIVAPGADPQRIVFDVTGAKRIRQAAQGDLVFKMGEDEIRWHEPVVYQEKDGARQEIAARYTITDANRVGFELAKYDATRPLYIDPLIYSTFLGGDSGDLGFGIAVDDSGSAYVTGVTTSTDFPTMNPLQAAYAGGNGDAFVAKINPEGSALVYSTYLGGSGSDQGNAITVDKAGNAYVTGYTISNDFPITPGAFQSVCNSGCIDFQVGFVSKINPAGSALVYSTYLGGSWISQGNSIAVDGAGNAYVTGFTSSSDFPVTPGAFQTTCSAGSNCQYYGDAFVSKINRHGSGLVYSTFLGGYEFPQGGNSGHGIAVDSAGNAYVAGTTFAPDFPTTPGAFQTTCKNPSNCGGAFVTKFNRKGSALVYSTYLGGSTVDDGFGIAIDSAGSAYVTGSTDSTDFPTMNPLQPTLGGLSNCFVTKFNPAGSALVYSTYLGGEFVDEAFGIAVDSAGNAYLTGFTRSREFPTVNPVQKYLKGFGSYAAFVSKINPNGSALVYSTYLNGASGAVARGIAVDSAGSAYITGDAGSDFPTMNPLQPVFGGGSLDAFVTKLHIPALTTTTLSSSLNPSTEGQAVTFTAVVTSNDGTPPDGETVTFIKGAKVWVTVPLSGGSASYTTSALKGVNVITAAYGGDSNFAASKSKSVKQVVNKAGE